MRIKFINCGKKGKPIKIWIEKRKDINIWWVFGLNYSLKYSSVNGDRTSLNNDQDLLYKSLQESPIL